MLLDLFKAFDYIVSSQMSAFSKDLFSFIHAQHILSYHLIKLPRSEWDIFFAIGIFNFLLCEKLVYIPQRHSHGGQGGGDLARKCLLYVQDALSIYLLCVQEVVTQFI